MMAISDGPATAGSKSGLNPEPVEFARGYFEKTRLQQVLPYMEHIAAGFELNSQQSAR